MVTRELILNIIALAIACVGAGIDFRIRKIPNKLTVPGMAAGIALNGIIFGWGGLLRGGLGLAVGFAAILLWMIGGLKAGDVKLYMVIGAFGGWQVCVSTILYSFLLGAVGAVIVMIRTRTGRSSLRHLWEYAKSIFLTRIFYTYEGASGAYFCFGWAIAAGVLATILKPLC